MKKTDVTKVLNRNGLFSEFNNEVFGDSEGVCKVFAILVSSNNVDIDHVYIKTQGVKPGMKVMVENMKELEKACKEVKSILTEND